MKKAIVIGCPGSGKTTFAEKLSRKMWQNAGAAGEIATWGRKTRPLQDAV